MGSGQALVGLSVVGVDAPARGYLAEQGAQGLGRVCGHVDGDLGRRRCARECRLAGSGQRWWESSPLCRCRLGLLFPTSRTLLTSSAGCEDVDDRLVGQCVRRGHVLTVTYSIASTEVKSWRLSMTSGWMSERLGSWPRRSASFHRGDSAPHGSSRIAPAAVRHCGLTRSVYSSAASSSALPTTG
jgi:hypothetical protein